MSHFKFSFRNFDLKLAQPFTIARGTKKVVNNVLVELTDGKHTGYGEAAPNSRYNEDAEKVNGFLKQIDASFFEEISQLTELTEALDNIASPVYSAKAAVEVAWLDWWGKSQNKPVWELWNAPSLIGPATSYTIGLDEIDIMQQKVRDARDFPIYKVKLGTDRDREIIRALREVTDKPVRVDANEGWTSLSEAKGMVDFLADHNIELVEQPMPAAQFEDLKKLRQISPLPLCADESFTGNEPLEHIAQAFDIINIKLMKIGSLHKAKKVIEEAKDYNLKVMIGCMIESSVANTAGALLSLWADYADLDGHLLIKDDPAAGLQLDEEKRIQLSDGAGLGIELRR